MNLLITGSTGFIGRRLVPYLLQQGHRVVLLGRGRETARHLYGEGIRFLEVDLLDPPPLSAIPAEDDLNATVHLASSLQFHGPRRELEKLNVQASLYVLRLSRLMGIPRFVFASSIEAMGPVARRDIPAPETLPSHPVSSYGRSKLRAEEELTRMAADTGIQLILLRIANVYDDSDDSFPQVLSRDLAAEGALHRAYPILRDIVIHPIHISDCVRAIELASTTTAVGVFNIAGPRCCRIGEIVDILGRGGLPHLPTFPPTWAARARVRLRNIRQSWRGRADLLTYWASGRPPRVHRGYNTGSAAGVLRFHPRITLHEGIASPRVEMIRRG